MKSPILGPGFGNGQETDWSGVCVLLLESGPGFWAPPSRDVHVGAREQPQVCRVAQRCLRADRV
ncbi:unnamed protein product, partial [Staurois parvus]